MSKEKSQGQQTAQYSTQSRQDIATDYSLQSSTHHNIAKLLGYIICKDMQVSFCDYLADSTAVKCTWCGTEISVPGGCRPCGCEGWAWREAGPAGGRTFPSSLRDTSTGPCRCTGLHSGRGSDRRLRSGRGEGSVKTEVKMKRNHE